MGERRMCKDRWEAFLGCEGKAVKVSSVRYQKGGGRMNEPRGFLVVMFYGNAVVACRIEPLCDLLFVTNQNVGV